jgi:hypothetical protein
MTTRSRNQQRYVDVVNAILGENNAAPIKGNTELKMVKLALGRQINPRVIGQELVRHNRDIQKLVQHINSGGYDAHRVVVLKDKSCDCRNHFSF